MKRITSRFSPYFSIMLVLLIAIPAMLALHGCSSRENPYQPYVADGAVIYHEACSRCHDRPDEAPRLLLGEVELTRQTIEKTLQRGARGMDRYPNIRDEYLDAVVSFLLEKSASVE